MKELLLVAPFVSLPGEPQFNRFLYLCYLWAQDYEVTLVTSSFCHCAKQQRDPKNPALADLPFKLVLLHEPDYKSNVSFARFWSHRIFHQSFQTWLNRQISQTRFPFDIVYSAFPLISTNLTLGKLKRSCGYKFIIDVQDIWPDSIFAAIPFLKTADFLIEPLRAKAHLAYSYADGLVAVSKTYLDVARDRAPNTPGHIAYLGSDYQTVESAVPQALDPAKIRLFYLGTLSHSYDIETVIKGFETLQNTFDNVELHILGDGPDRDRLEKRSKNNVFYHGYLPYEKMLSFAKACHFAINPIVGSATQSITNKLSDYVAIGLPILSSQQNLEAMEIVKAQGGYLFEPGSAESFAASARRAVEDYLSKGRSKGRSPNHQHSQKSQTAIAERPQIDRLFDRRISYPQIANFIEQIYALEPP